MSVTFRRLLGCSMLLLALPACGADAVPGSPGTERLYKVAFTNDTSSAVVVTGCPECGQGRALAAGLSWETALTGGDTEVSFERDGGEVGCVHFINGVIPEDDAPASVIKVSEYSPCRK